MVIICCQKESWLLFWVSYISSFGLLVEVNEGEGERHAERDHLVRAAASLPGLEGDHQVNVARGTLTTKLGHQIRTEEVVQEALERFVDRCKKKGSNMIF